MHVSQTTIETSSIKIDGESNCRGNINLKNSFDSGVTQKPGRFRTQSVLKNSSLELFLASHSSVDGSLSIFGTTIHGCFIFNY